MANEFIANQDKLLVNVIKILRWIICVPAGMISGFLVYIIFSLLGHIAIPLGSIVCFLVDLLGAGLSGAVAVYASALIVPSQKKLLSLIIVALSLIGLILVVPIMVNNHAWNDIVFSIAQNAGAIYMAYKVFKWRINICENPSPKQQPNSLIEAALKSVLIYYELCKACLDKLEPSPSEKFSLAANLYLLGAVDCISQMYKLSDVQFAELAQRFFSKIGVDGKYTAVLLVFFAKMNTNSAAMHCIVEGGHSFNEWVKDNTLLPLATRSSIKRFEEHPDFPDTIGHLYVIMDKTKINSSDSPFSQRRSGLRR